jgi:predicted deacylase
VQQEGQVSAMKERIIYELPGLYRDNMRVKGFEFGEGKEAACIVGAMRGNEVQQLYVASQLVKRLAQEEEDGKLIYGKILVIPAVNPYSINIGKRFWPTDNTDINRMYPGYDKGETTQRIAAGVFEEIKDYPFGIQLASFYMPGEFVPHVRIMDAGFPENIEYAKQYGMPYVILRNTRPYDTTTLNYNWQIWESHAVSLYTTTTTTIDKDSTQQAIRAILRFLALQGILEYHGHGGYVSRVIDDRRMVSIRTKSAGFFESHVRVGFEVMKGKTLGRIVNPLTGQIDEILTSPIDAIVLFQHTNPLTYADTAVFKLIPLEDD